MTPRSLPLLVRAGLAIVGGSVVLAGLAACSSDPEPEPGPHQTVTAAPSQAPEETPTPTPTPEATGSTVALTCDELLTMDDVYAFNPNFGTAPDYVPTAGSAVETAAGYNGLVCGWSNQTSGDLIEFAVVAPNDVLMSQRKNTAVAETKAVPTYGAPPIEGFFSIAGGPGVAQVFTGPYWVVAQSPAFFEPGDAQTLLTAAVSHLP
ncbi:iron ABC transporter ATP-binding protein [Glaciibacter superstes]|uniref:iron ABC transporter ATP-binding protein n=1 Tax=Glaciibacter superstes TaxID=501023 RepID=UPI0012FC4B79|nr:iron ABC transporter ATP-binding protein [Glaciibacter superstes]